MDKYKALADATQYCLAHGIEFPPELIDGLESIGSLTDADFAAYEPFKHILASEFAAAAGALVAVNTTLGTNSTSNWAKLLKIVDIVPH